MLSSYNSKTTVSLQIVHQVAVLSSFTGNLHCCKSGRCAPFLQQYGYMSRTDGQRVKEQSNNRVILQNDILSYLGE